MASGLESFLDRVFSMPANYVLGFICLFIMIFMRRVQVGGGNHFNRMFEVRQPSFQPTPSAFNLVTRGTLGCVQAVIGFILFIVFLLFALDGNGQKSHRKVLLYRL